MKSVILLLLFLFFCASGHAQRTLDKLLNKYNTESIPYISVEELKKIKANDSIILLDTREEYEFLVSHIPSAQYVGFSSFSSENFTTTHPDKDTPIVVYCSLGVRSEEIGEKLKKLGYANVQNLYGGIFEWKNKDLPIEDKHGVPTDSVHTFSKEWSKWLLKGIKTYN